MIFFRPILKASSNQSELENQLKDFLNKNNEINFPADINVPNTQKNNIFLKIPISCWSYLNDCKTNCENLKFQSSCAKKIHKMFSEEYQYCCYLLEGGQWHA